MAMIDNPCFDCTTRKVGCHITCTKHIIWQKAKEENKKLIARAKGVPYYKKKGMF